MSNTINVPIVSQESNNVLCWAACVVSVGQYYKGYTITTPEDVSNVILGKLARGTTDDVQTALRTFYKINTDVYSGQMPYNTVINYLMGSVPLLVGFANPAFSTGHMTVVCGFSYSSGATIAYYMMDPMESSLRIVSASTSGPISIDDYSGVPLYWNEAVYKTS